MNLLLKVWHMICNRERKLRDGDYVLKDGCAWLRIKNISVRVHETDEGVVTDLWPVGAEFGDEPIASTYAFFSEAEKEEGEWNGL